jgi:hypothetical protein
LLFNGRSRDDIDHYSVNKKILTSQVYVKYKYYIVPCEMFIAKAWKGLLARQIVLIVKKDDPNWCSV